MKSNKGFTLIELLAVIVILAIIALIATPIILGIIEDSRKSAVDRTAELIASEIQLAYSGYMLKSQPNADADNFCTYMNNDTNSTIYFSMDQASLGTCNSSTKTVVVTVGTGANAKEYTATYASGTVTVSYSGGNNSSKDVKLK